MANSMANSQATRRLYDAEGDLHPDSGVNSEDTLNPVDGVNAEGDVHPERSLDTESDVSRRIPRAEYETGDVVGFSRYLIGKVLCSRTDAGVTSGMITETEAYCGRNDKACHANNGLRTPRTEVLYGPPGHTYVYLCYGIHHLLNVVTNREGLADAILIRAVMPLEGVHLMSRRRSMESHHPRLTDGPGKMTQAMGITTDDDGTDLLGDRIWIEDRGVIVPDDAIQVTERIGIDYAGEDARKPWRFHIPKPRQVFKDWAS